MGGKRFVKWFCTVWNKLDSWGVELKELFGESMAMSYLAGRAETCPKTGKHHWHLVVHFSSKKSMKFLAAALGIKKKADGGGLG